MQTVVPKLAYAWDYGDIGIGPPWHKSLFVERYPNLGNQTWSTTSSTGRTSHDILKARKSQCSQPSKDRLRHLKF